VCADVHGTDLPDCLFQGDRCYLAIPVAYHFAEFFFDDQINCRNPEIASHAAIIGTGGATPLEMAQANGPRFQTGSALYLNSQAFSHTTQ
jgi:hypothetical protein